MFVESLKCILVYWLKNGSVLKCTHNIVWPQIILKCEFSKNATKNYIYILHKVRVSEKHT